MALVIPVIARTILEARQDPEGFWGKATEQLSWFRKWDKVPDWTPPTFSSAVISAFVVLKQGFKPSDELKHILLDTVRRELDPVAVISELNFVNMLPKTRSGKIMRRVLKAVALGREPGDITTIEDEGSVDEARHAWEEMKKEVAAHTAR